MAPLAKDRREKKLFRKGLIDDIATLGGQKAIPKLTQIAISADEDIDLRCRAAVRIITLTDGAINDMCILDGLQGNFIPGNFLERNTSADNRCVSYRAYSAVAKNGKTDEIRRVARERRDPKPN